jgi:hypothetical protein
MSSFSFEDPIFWLVALALFAAALGIGWWLARLQKRRELRRDFGPEYDREVEAFGSRSKAEGELAARRRRVEGYRLRDLDVAERRELAARWMAMQKDFVDDPSHAVEEASLLIDEAMIRRGYPLADLRQKEADLSVHHPEEVREYRRAWAIAERNRRREATTEELREATVCYRTLFERLAGLREEPYAQRETA